MNYLKEAHGFKNHYIVLRHGRSEANDAGIIVSHPSTGTKDYGLTEKGKEQVILSVKRAQKQGLLNNQTIIYTSDFKRAVETAEIARNVLRTRRIRLTPALRERYFGDFDNQPNGNYARVWANDKRRRKQNYHNVESVDDVESRVTKLVLELEQTYKNTTILLVAHADTLHVLQTAFHGASPTRHRLLSHIKLAEIRPLARR